MGTLWSALGGLPDRRTLKDKRYSLVSIVAMPGAETVHHIRSIWQDFPRWMQPWARVLALSLLVAPLLALVWIREAYSRIPSKSVDTDLLTLDCTKPDDREIALTYYDYLREEIKREDEITHQRITWTMTFQGFIVTATTLLLIAEFNVTRQLMPAARLPVFAFAFIGLFTGLVSLMGILASRHPVRDAATEWKPSLNATAKIGWLLKRIVLGAHRPHR